MSDIIWNSKSLSRALDKDIDIDIKAENICYSSSDIIPGDIFIALPGENKHGVEYIEDAFKRGASCAISDRKFEDPRVILVDNSYKAFNKLAEYKRSNSIAKFIGVTGSAGKTSTKEALRTILSAFGKTYANKDSYNNHTGVPLSLASISDDTIYSVNEIGMNNAGEVRNLTNLVKPDIAIITNISEAHMGGEGLGTLANICKAKCEIFEYMTKDGFAILNIDNSTFDIQKSILKNLEITKIYTFGEGEKADCRVIDYVRDEDHALVTYSIFDRIYHSKNYLIGKHQAINFAAAFLVPYTLGLNMDLAVKASENVRPYDGRGVTSVLNYNGHKYTIIDDAYNANPASVKAALKNLSEIAGVKIAILADMRELGPKSAEMHADLSNFVIETGVSKLFTLCEYMKYLNDELSSKLESYHYHGTSDKSFHDILSKFPNSDATILVKGSKGTKVKRFVEYFSNYIKK